MGKDSQPSPGSTERPRQDKPKEEHTQTVIKLTKTKDKDKLLTATREKKIQGNSHKVIKNI